MKKYFTRDQRGDCIVSQNNNAACKIKTDATAVKSKQMLPQNRLFTLAPNSHNTNHAENRWTGRPVKIAISIAVGVIAAYCIITSDTLRDKLSGMDKNGLSSRDNELFHESMRVLGHKTGVLCVDNELFTFDRKDQGSEIYHYSASFELPFSSKDIWIDFAASKNPQTINFKTKTYKGTISLTQRSDGSMESKIALKTWLFTCRQTGIHIFAKPYDLIYSDILRQDDKDGISAAP